MKQSFLAYLLFNVLLFCSCSESDEQEYSNFTEKQPQSVSERTVKSLIPEDSLIVAEDIPELSLSYLELNETSLFTDAGEYIVRLSKLNFSREQVIRLPEGSGPGEVVNFNVVSFGIVNEDLVFYDKNSKKTMLYDLDGTFREEFLNDGYPKAGMALADERISYFLVMPLPAHEYLFYEVERNGSESMVQRKFQQLKEERNLLAYGGTITYHDNALYYAGRSEPILRKYDLRKNETELVYSRAVIDDYNSENNYERPQERGEFVSWRYTDSAKFASVDVAVDDKYLYSIRHHNDQVGYKYLDIYDTEDGSYMGSFRLKYYPQYIAVDEEYIFTIEELGTVEYLMKYPMPEMDF